MAKIKGALAAATSVALVVLALDTPARHAHALTERSLEAHDHVQNPEAGGQERCSDGLHFHAASAQRHEACSACLRASHRAGPLGSPLVAGSSLLPDPAGLKLPAAGLNLEPPAGLPEGRAPPLN